MSSINSYLNQDEDAVTSVHAVNIRSINSKENLREKVICCVIKDDDKTEKQAEVDGNFDID